MIWLLWCRLCCRFGVFVGSRFIVFCCGMMLIRACAHSIWSVVPVHLISAFPSRGRPTLTTMPARGPLATVAIFLPFELEIHSGFVGAKRLFPIISIMMGVHSGTMCLVCPLLSSLWSSSLLLSSFSLSLLSFG